VDDAFFLGFSHQDPFLAHFHMSIEFLLGPCRKVPRHFLSAQKSGESLPSIVKDICNYVDPRKSGSRVSDLLLLEGFSKAGVFIAEGFSTSLFPTWLPATHPRLDKCSVSLSFSQRA